MAKRERHPCVYCKYNNQTGNGQNTFDECLQTTLPQKNLSFLLKRTKVQVREKRYLSNNTSKISVLVVLPNSLIKFFMYLRPLFASEFLQNCTTSIFCYRETNVDTAITTCTKATCFWRA